MIVSLLFQYRLPTQATCYKLRLSCITVHLFMTQSIAISYRSSKIIHHQYVQSSFWSYLLSWSSDQIHALHQLRSPIRLFSLLYSLSFLTRGSIYSTLFLPCLGFFSSETLELLYLICSTYHPEVYIYHRPHLIFWTFLD